jgi:hypothetical protein
MNVDHQWTFVSASVQLVVVLAEVYSLVVRYLLNSAAQNELRTDLRFD